MLLRVAICGPTLAGKGSLARTLSELPTRNTSVSQQRLEFFEIHEPVTNFDMGYHLVLIMYDLTDQDSYDEAIEMAQKVLHAPRLLVGNKLDLNLRRAVNRKAAVKEARNLDLFYREISAQNSRDVEELKEIIEDIVDYQIKHRSKWGIRVSNHRYSQLKVLCRWLAVTTMLQGLVVLSYGSLLFLCLQDYQQWLGDALMFGGTLTFMIAFLGFYGTRFYGVKEYLEIYLLMVVLNFVYKLVTVVYILLAEYQLDLIQPNSIVHISILISIIIICIVNDAVIIFFNSIERLAALQRKTNLDLQVSS